MFLMMRLMMKSAARLCLLLEGGIKKEMKSTVQISQLNLSKRLSPSRSLSQWEQKCLSAVEIQISCVSHWLMSNMGWA